MFLPGLPLALDHRRVQIVVHVEEIVTIAAISMIAAGSSDDPVIAEVAEDAVVAIGRTGSGTGGGIEPTGIRRSLRAR